MIKFYLEIRSLSSSVVYCFYCDMSVEMRQLVDFNTMRSMKKISSHKLGLVNACDSKGFNYIFIFIFPVRLDLINSAMCYSLNSSILLMATSTPDQQIISVIFALNIFTPSCYIRATTFTPQSWEIFLI